MDIIAHYDREVHSQNWAMQLPSVIALRQYVKPSEFPAFTRFNVFPVSYTHLDVYKRQLSARASTKR